MALLVVDELEVVAVEAVVVTTVGRVKARTSLRPAGTCEVWTGETDAVLADDSPPGRPVMDVMVGVVAFAALMPVGMFGPGITGSWAMAAAVMAYARASTLRSLRSTLTLTPPCSLWTHRFNWVLVGLVPRMDSNVAMTRRPAGVSARGLVTSAWAFAPESSTRSSRHEADVATDGANRC